MRSSIPVHKFLLDENVRIELFKLLRSQHFDVKSAPKGSSDNTLALISKKEKRVLVTNDTDFEDCGKDEIFSVILLKIPQSDAKSLMNSFENLANEIKKFEGKLIILESNSWKEFPLITVIKN